MLDAVGDKPATAVGVANWGGTDDGEAPWQPVRRNENSVIAKKQIFRPPKWREIFNRSVQVLHIQHSFFYNPANLPGGQANRTPWANSIPHALPPNTPNTEKARKNRSHARQEF
jgi:hypothetical protein